jgi:hypothetical protein
MVVGLRKMRRRHVRPDDFHHLSELVLGEGESRGYQKVTSDGVY